MKRKMIFKNIFIFKNENMFHNERWIHDFRRLMWVNESYIEFGLVFDCCVGQGNPKVVRYVVCVLE